MRVLSALEVLTRDSTMANSSPPLVLPAICTPSACSVTVPCIPSLCNDACADRDTFSSGAATTRSPRGGLQVTHGLTGATVRKLPDHRQPPPTSAVSNPAQAM